MSGNVDERVVSLKFDNKEFEANAQQSMKVLEDLNKNLENFAKNTGDGKVFDTLSSSIQKTDFSTMQAGVDAVANRFTNLGIVGVTAIQNITNKAVDSATRLVKSLTIDPVSMGFNEYELKMDSIRTIMSSTGESIEVVNGYLNELNKYSDETIYSFSDMTNNIGKFTNAGVKLKDAVSAIKGISNVAAVSGANAQEASRAMYNFSQALSSGYVKLIDWKSIENANMATKEFKEQLLETAAATGELTKKGDVYLTKKGTEISATKNFNDSLQEQWMTTKVLTRTLHNYSVDVSNMKDEERKAYEDRLKRQGYTKEQIKNIEELGTKAMAAARDVTTWSKLVDTLQEAVQSGWAQTFEIVFGNINEAKAMWTAINEVVSGFITTFDNARNNYLQAWKDAGGRAALLKSLANIIAYIGSMLKPIAKAFREIFPPASGKTLAAATKKFEKFTKTLKLSKETADNIKETFRGLFSVIGLFKDIAVSLVKAIFPSLDIFSSLSAMLFAITGAIGRLVSTTVEFIRNTKIIQTIFAGIGIGVKVIVYAFRLLSRAFVKVLTVTTQFVNGIFGKLLNQMLKFINVVKKVGGGIKDYLVKQFEKHASPVLVSYGKLIKGTGKEIVEFIKRHEPLEKITKNVSTNMRMLGNIIANFASEKKKQLVSFFSELKRSEEVEKLRQKVLVLSIAFKALQPIIKQQVVDSFKILFERIKSLNILSHVGDLIERVADKVTDLAKAISKNFKPLETLKEILNPKQFTDYAKAADKAKEGVDKVGDSAKKAVEKNGPVEGFRNLIAKLSQTVQTTSIGKTITEVRDKILEILNSTNIDQAIDRSFGITKIIGTLVLVKQSGKLVSSAAGVMDSMASVLMSFSGLTTSLSNLAKQAKTNLKINAFKTIAISIGIVVASVYLLSRMSKKELIQGLVSAGIIFGMLFAVLKVLTSEQIDAGKLKAAGIAFAGMGASMLMIAIAVKSFSKIKPADLAKAGVSLMAFIGIFTAASRLAAKDMSGLVGFLAISMAMGILVPAIIMMSRLDFNTMVRGGGAIFSFIVILGLASKIAMKNKSGFGMFIGIAAAVATMVPAIITLALLPMEKALKSATVLTAIMLALGTSVRIASSGSGGSAFMVAAMAAMITGLTASLMALAFIPFTKLLKGVITMSAIMIILANTSKTMYMEKTKILGITSILAILAASLYLMGSMDVEKAGLNMLGLAALLGVFTQAAAIMEIIPFSAIFKAIASMILIIGALTGVITALGVFATQCDKAKSYMEKGAEIGKYIGEFVGNIIGGLIAGTSSGFAIFAKNLSTFMTELQPFINSVKSIPPNVATGAKAIAQAIFYITAAELLDRFNSFRFDSGGKTTGMVKFATDIVALAGSIKEIANKVKNIENFDQITRVANLISALGKAATAVPTVGGIRGKIMGVHDLTAFGNSLKNIIPVLGSIHKADEDGKGTTISFGYISKVAKVIGELGNAAQTIPDTGGFLKKKIIGIKDLSVFGTQLSSFMPELNKAAKNLTSENSSISDKSLPLITNVAEVIGALGKAVQEIPEGLNGKGLKARLEGAKSLKSFATGLSDIAKVLPGLIEASSGLNKDVVEKINMMSDVIVSLSSAANKVSTISGGNKKTLGSNLQKDIANLAQFSTKMKEFVPSFKEFAVEAGKIGESDLTAANMVSKSMNAIAGAYKKLVESGGWKGGGNDIVSKLSKLAKAMKDYSKNVSNMETDNLEANSAAVASSISKISKAMGKTDSFKKSGSKSITAYTKSISSDASISSANSAGKTISDAVVKGLSGEKKFVDAGSKATKAFAKGLRSGTTARDTGASVGNLAKDGAKGADFYGAGKTGANGFARGLKDPDAVADVASAGTALGNAAYKAAKKAIKSHSPSRKFMELGRYSDEGFAIGLRKYSNLVYKEGEETGRKAVKGARTGYEKIITELPNPSIKPVVDLTGVRKGAKTINGILAATGTDINPSYINRSINNQSSMAENMRMADRFDKIASKMAENQKSATNYNIGDVTVDVSKLEDVTTLNDFVSMLRHAKAFN